MAGIGITLTRRDLRRLVRGETDLERQGSAHRPRTRGECVDGPRPCPWVGCRHHLYLEVMDQGHIKLPWGLRDLEDLPETCSLDVADRGGQRLREVGLVMNVTRERIRQIETHALVVMWRRLRRICDLPGV